LLALVGVLHVSASARELRTPEFLEKARPGFDLLFNLDYGEGQRRLEKLIDEFPGHPGPPLYLASAFWLEELYHRQELDLGKFVSLGYFAEESGREMPPERRRLFFDYLAKSRELCELILSESPDNLEARYFLGATYGVEASFAFTIDRSRGDAFDLGKKAYRLHSELLKEAPDFYDAYMTVGLYEYIVGNLPWYIRWIATIIGYRGSEERGFHYLEKAAEHADFVADDTRVLLMVLFVREERHDEALRNAERLHAKYPRSYILHLNRAQILEERGETAEALRVYREVARRAVDGVRNYQRLPLGTFSYQVGVKHRKAGQLSTARGFLEQALEDSATPAPEKTRVHLELGKVLDLLGERELALAHYRTVLELPDVEGAQSEARRFLERPHK
jgi:tetratricopeptide (TPR) repeat protein